MQDPLGSGSQETEKGLDWILQFQVTQRWEKSQGLIRDNVTITVIHYNIIL
jgi:hypothetical protein